MGESLQRASDASGMNLLHTPAPTRKFLTELPATSKVVHWKSHVLLFLHSPQRQRLVIKKPGDRKSTAGMICSSTDPTGSITTGLNKKAMEQYQRHLECSAPFQKPFRPKPQPACPAMWKGKCQSYSWMPDPNLPRPADPFGQPIWEQDGWHRAAVAECADTF